MRFVVHDLNKKASPRLQPLDLVKLASVRVYFHWSTFGLCRCLFFFGGLFDAFVFFVRGTSLRGILLKVATTLDCVVNSVMLKICQRRNVAWWRTAMQHLFLVQRGH
jgi:hypothetical protein